MISSAKNFFGPILKDLVPKFKEHKDIYEADENAMRKLKGHYSYEFGDLDNVGVDDSLTVYEDSLPVEITMYFDAKKKPVESLENAMDIAQSIRLACIKYGACAYPVKKVTCSKISHAPLDQYSDNNIKVTLHFELLIISPQGI